MNLKFPLCLSISLPTTPTVLLVSAALLQSGAAFAAEGQFYFGAGGGQSTIKPAVRGVDVNTGFEVVDDSDGLIKLFAGYDLTDYWSIEGFYGNYGTAELSGPSRFSDGGGSSGLGSDFLGDSEIVLGTVDYTVVGAQTLIQFPGNNAGLSGLLKIGVSQILTDSSSNLPFTQADEIKFTTGFGMEYQLQNGVAVRAEYEYQEENVQGVTINALKRFGKPKVKTIPAPKVAGSAKPAQQAPQQQKQTKPKQPQVQPKQVAKNKVPIALPKSAAPKPVQNVPAPVPLPRPGLSLAVPIDSDADGVIDQVDNCPGTTRGSRVTSNGCPVVTAEPIQPVSMTRILDGVTFTSGSATLTPEARDVLNGITAELLKKSGISIAVVGHTDDQGDAEKNKMLSERRAEAVANYIASKGFPSNLLRFGGKGEELPIASNDDAEGRAVNRRVELIEERKGLQGASPKLTF